MIAVLRSAEAELCAWRVAHATLFGSKAYGERPDSDIMVELDPAASLGVYEYVGVANYTGDMFPTKVDVSNREAMWDYVRPDAEHDALNGF